MDHDVARRRRGGAVTTGGRVMPTVRALMAGVVDYAGLFPPAALPMPEAVRRYASYRDGPHAWMLGRFVLPVARIEEFAEAFAQVHPGAPSHAAGPWRLSAIATAADAAALAACNARYGSRAWIDAVEAPPVAPAGVAALGELAQTYAVFAEVAADPDPGPFIAECAARRVRAKIRTGGVTAGAFPTPDQLARFILACRAARVPFKATAGLHHAFHDDYPLTYEPHCDRATMFGFVNVILAAAAAGVGADAAEVARVLVAGDAFTIDAVGVLLPTGRRLSAGDVATARASAMLSFGSCSFDEPVAELHGRALL
jgi:hypothetical protein